MIPYCVSNNTAYREQEYIGQNTSKLEIEKPDLSLTLRNAVIFNAV